MIPINPYLSRRHSRQSTACNFPCVLPDGTKVHHKTNSVFSRQTARIVRNIPNIRKYLLDKTHYQGTPLNIKHNNYNSRRIRNLQVPKDVDSNINRDKKHSNEQYATSFEHRFPCRLFNQNNVRVGGSIKRASINEIDKVKTGYAQAYKFGGKIGKGSYAVVREGIHLSKSQKVAIKIYEKSLLSEPRRQKRVEAEIAILKLLNHNNIVKFYDTFQTTNHLYLVTELVRGQSLHNYIKERQKSRLCEKEALRIFKDIVIAIEYCHSMNVVHRDIKLDNILIDLRGNVKIIDFGFSAIEKSNQLLDTHCGTLSYMAPEVIRKRDYHGPPADIWALGVVLYAMLFGYYPFRGENDEELVKSIKKGSIVFPEEVSERTQNIISNLLKVNPEDRMTSKELLDYLFRN